MTWVIECMWKHAKPKGCVQTMVSVSGVLAGGEAKRMPWSREEQGLGLGLPQNNILLFQDKKREVLPKGIGIYLGSLKLTRQEKTQSGWYIQGYK